MSVKQIKLLFAFIGLLQIGFSQFNDSVHYRIYYATTGVINKTDDVSSYVLNNALNFGVKNKDVSMNSNTSYIFGQQENVKTNNDFSTSLDFNLSKTFPHFYYWGLGNFDKSFSLKINNRLQAGLGGAYNFIDKKQAFLNVSEGIIYENSNLQLADGSNDIYHTFRNSLRLRYHWVINQILVLDGTNFFQNSLSYKNDNIIKLVNSISIKPTKWLSLTTAANFNRITRSDRQNLLITFGISIEKYF